MKRQSLCAAACCIYMLAVLSSCKKSGPDLNGGPAADESAGYIVSTFAGNGTNGNDPQTGGLALLYFPGNTVSDAQGNLYIADGGNSKIRKVTPAGAMTTFAGSNTPGNADGTGTAATFSNPLLLALDAQGNLFVGDVAGLRIRKITPGGVVTTIAGNGTAGVVDGMGTASQVDIMGGIAVDPAGNVYFTQQNYHGVRKISTTGMVSSFVGGPTPGFAEGTGAAARFNEAYSLVCDAAGYLYVSDNKNARIRRVSPAGVVTTFLKRSSPEEMHNITMDKQGNFYIVQGVAGKSEIMKYDTQGSISKIAGGELGYKDGNGNVAMFSYSTGLSVNANGDIYFSDLLNHVIRKIRRL
jgi:serine/threonine protein kinase, bacterial